MICIHPKSLTTFTSWREIEMKVYIVTSGCYSGYNIKRVFLQKEKAEIYKNIINSDNDIEEYNTSDDEIGSSIYDKSNNIKPLWDISCEYYPRDNIFDIYNIKATTTESYKGDQIFFSNDIIKKIDIVYSLPQKEGEDEDEFIAKIYDKMKKISQDFWAIIQEQTANGATDDEIYDMLNAKNEE